jgi:hypothetical protein
MQERNTRHASWRELLASPSPASHIAQIYDSDEFVTAAVSLFAAEGLRRGEIVLLTGTPSHLAGLRRALAEQRVDAQAAIREGQLRLFDAQEAMRAILVEDKIDAARFQAAAGEAIVKARLDSRFSGVRWWGEISNVLHLAGNARAALAAEELAEKLARQHRVTVLCSYLFDRFDAQGYDGMLREIYAKHSHGIPADDYVRHRLAVNRAIAEVVGDIKGPLLQSLLSWKGLACDLPSSQALLFWVREVLPEHFEAVLSRARAYQLREPA